jgi:hypothetical protein
LNVIPVKRVFSSAMLLVFLLNTLGFYGIFMGLQVKYALDANKNLDQEKYAGEEEMLFKVPITVPYNLDHQDFQRVTGEFEHHGEVYRLVKRKFANDTLYVVCVKDHAIKKINTALADCIKAFTDKPLSTKNSKPVPSFSKDYLVGLTGMDHQSTGWTKDVTYGEEPGEHFSVYLPSIKYPPKFNSLS